MVTYKEGKCFLGKTLLLSDGTVELEVTLEVGPRVISLKKIGQENIMYQDEHDYVNRDCSAIYGAGKQWHIYGGHRMWLSPEGEQTYYPDNGAVAVVRTPNGAIFTPEKWEVCNLQPSLEIEMQGNGVMLLKHSFKNLNQQAQPLCVWVLTVLKTGGEETVPLSTQNTGLLANRNFVLWPYTDLADPRFTLKNDCFQLRGVEGAPTSFKIGIYNQNAQAIYCHGNTKFVKTVLGVGEPNEYPDFNCNLETYTAAHIHEVETLSPTKMVAPGGTITHIEKWEVSTCN